MELPKRSVSLSAAAALLAAFLLLARASPLPPADYSGEEVDEAVERSSSSSPQPQYLSLALLIQSEAATLKAELCNKYAVCDNSMEVLVQNNLILPKITAEDGCFRSGFRQEKCLKKITSGLMEFQTYFLIVENTFSNERELAEGLWHKTKHLATIINLMMKNPIALPATYADRLELKKKGLLSDDVWIQKVTTRLILRDFTLFIEKTIRAIRFLSTRSHLDI